MTDAHYAVMLRYIVAWLDKEGYRASKWDGKSEDGNWLLHAITESDGSKCFCCLEPMLNSAKKHLEKSCGWISLHFEAMEFLAENGAVQ